MNDINLLEVLAFINPADLNYSDWCAVGMALKHEGYTAADWASWSRSDPGRYHEGECESKWLSFAGSLAPVTGATVVQMAKDRGWRPSGRELEWDEEIGTKRDDLVVVDHAWIEGREVAEPQTWNPAQQLITYLETLFNSDENVGYVTRSYEQDGRYIPSKGCWDRTAGQLIELLSKCNGDVGAVLGDYNPEVGAWIRFNPLDGKGVKNDNVTDFRFALVESDSVEIEKQNAIMRELELPIACLVHSGNKSIHAIVRIDAANYQEYRRRVDFLYSICKKNGLDVDTQNRNPSRLSRMPGVSRKDKKQFLIDTNIGKSSWDEWVEWINSVNDDLPDAETLSDVWDDLPELAPPLIENVLRQGHKMLLVGPSKAGKSYALIELCCSIAEGKPWFGFQCAQGRVLYVNLELDGASCLHRFRDVYDALGWAPDNIRNISIWNLRGHSCPMDKLAPKLIRRAAKQNFSAIIIDPIYKIITGDENSADQMAAFCNQFDKVATSLGCSVIYSHHHSKGAQGDKRSMDRASGSGVFARDPDALLDMIELQASEAMIKQATNNAVCDLCREWLKRFDKLGEVSQDDLCSSSAVMEACGELLPSSALKALQDAAKAAGDAVSQRTAWRIDGTLREFPRFKPINLWFTYPVHQIDDSMVLHDAAPETQRKQSGMGRQTPQDKKKERMRQLEIAFEAAAFGKVDGEPITITDIMENSEMSRNSVKNYVDEHPDFKRDKSGEITRIQ